MGGVMLIKFILFGLAGILASLTFTAIRDAIRNRDFGFTGQASLILFPAYGLIALIYPMIAIHVGKYPWYGRGVIYMLAFYVLQYGVGFGLSKLELCPWSYSGNGSLGGLIRIADAPVWFAAGLAIEYAYPHIKTMATVLG